MKKSLKRVKTVVAKIVNNENFQRFFCVSACICLFSICCMAQGANAFTSAQKEISSYIEPVRKLIYVIATVLAIVGAFNIYHKMTNGDQDVKKTIMLTLGGCIALVVLSEALPKFFGM